MRTARAFSVPTTAARRESVKTDSVSARRATAEMTVLLVSDFLNIILNYKLFLSFYFVLFKSNYILN